MPQITRNRWRSMNTFFRYPGGKTKLRKPILAAIASLTQGTEICSYREPFFGAGSIGLAVLEDFPQFKKYHINDKNPALASLWSAIIRYPDDLIATISHYQPSVFDFVSFKSDLLALTAVENVRDLIVHYGFLELAIHQMSYSGLGTKSGGPLGGKDQISVHGKVDSRWSPERLARKIKEAHSLFVNVEIHDGCCTSADFSDVFDEDEKAFIYLDPPYYEKGGEVYQHAFTEQDHIRLADVLKYTNHDWVLSYDACEEIESLYAGWSVIKKIEVGYTMNGSRVKPELLITPKGNDNFSNQCCAWKNSGCLTLV